MTIRTSSVEVRKVYEPEPGLMESYPTNARISGLGPIFGYGVYTRDEDGLLTHVSDHEHLIDAHIAAGQLEES